MTVTGGRLVALAGLALLAACVETAPPLPAPKPAPQPAPPAIAPLSAESLAERDRLDRLQTHLLAQGLLRTDGGGRDAPFADWQLARNFQRIAFYDEFVAARGSLVAREMETTLKRWDKPIRFGIVFGASVPEAQRARDRATIRAYVARLSRITGHPMSMGETGNFTVMILNADERRGAEPLLRAAVPPIAQAAVRAVTFMAPETDCQMFAFTAGGGSAYTDAIAVIRGEQPDLSRIACIHEEIAQGLGLSNDSRAARPSIFNDDEEFAFLTRHDELLLRILYDARLAPGMTQDTARPIVETIAAELMGGAS